MADREGDAILRVVAPTGESVPAKGYIFYSDNDGDDCSAELDQVAKGVLRYQLEEDEEVQAALIVPHVEGFWATRSEDCGDGETIVCDALEDEDQTNWWHALLSSAIDVPDRGRGIRIGVVDSGFASFSGLEHITHIEVGEGQATEFPRRGFWRHGEAVCRILGDRKASLAAAPIAPGAEIFFASASFTAASCRDPDFVFPADDGSPEDELDPRLVNAALHALTATHQVDIVNLSLGSFDIGWEESGLALAISQARARGAIVIAAAGNEPRAQAAFPAILEECIGVGAVGAADWGPSSSVARYFADLAEDFTDYDGQTLFYHPESAYGEGVDVVAPGVGIMIARDGKLAFDVTGTSFAAPIVSGLLAIELSTDASYLSLPRTEARTRRAEAVLQRLCNETDFCGTGAGCKIVSL